MNNSRSQVREQRLQQALQERAEIMVRMADPEIQKDKKENSEYDILREQLKTVEMQIDKITAGKLAPYIPGTFNVGDKLLVTYTKIVSYGEEKELPKKPVTIELVDFFDITTYGELIDVNEIGLIKVTTSSCLGQAIVNKAHRKIRFNTQDGYCEIEVEPIPS